MGTGGFRVRLNSQLAFDTFDVVTTPQIILKKEEEGPKEKPEVNSRNSTSRLINNFSFSTAFMIDKLSISLIPSISFLHPLVSFFLIRPHALIIVPSFASIVGLSSIIFNRNQNTTT